MDCNIYFNLKILKTSCPHNFQISLPYFNFMLHVSTFDYLSTLHFFFWLKLFETHEIIRSPNILYQKNCITRSQQFLYIRYGEQVQF